MKLKQISRRTVSVVLAVLMVLSTLLVGSISTVNAANNGDTLYLWNYKDSDFNSAKAVEMDYDSTNSVYTTTVDVKSTSSWQWWCLFVSTSSSAKTPLWSEFPTYDKTNAKRINQVETRNRDGINVIHYESNDNVLHSATTGYVKITYSLTDNKITFSDAESTGGGETTLSCPTEVLKETNVMFYVAGYTDSDASKVNTGLSNGDDKNPKFISGTIINGDDNGTRYAYVSVPSKDLSTYTYITHKVNNWLGYKNTSIPNAKGGELYYGNTGKETSSFESRTTADVNLSSSSVEQGTSSISLTNTLSAITPAYGSDLYVMYYLYGGTNYKLLNSDTASTKVSSTSVPYTIDTSRLSAGNYTVKTVLTDSKVYYVADSDKFTVTEATNTYNINYGTFTNGTVTGPTSAKEGDTVKLTVTPAEGYKLSSITAGTTATVNVSDYTFTMPACDVTINATFTSTTPATTAKVYLKNTANWGKTLKAYAWSGSGNTATKYLGDYPGTAMTFVKDNIYSIDVDTNATNILFTNNNDGSNKTGDLSLTKADVDGTKYNFATTELIYDNKDNKWSLYNTVKSNITIDEDTANGKISNVAPGTANIESGTTVKVTVEPNEGYVCSNVTYNGTSAHKDSDTEYTFTMPAEDVKVSATFTEKAETPERNLYVAGRFAVKDANGTVYKTADNNDWNETCTNDKLKFQRVGTSDIYKLETGYTLQEIVNNDAGFNSSAPWYIRFYDKDNNKKYAPSTATALTASYAGADNAQATALDGGQSFWFTGNETSYVTLYLVASTDAPKFYFELSESNNFSVTMTQGISNFNSNLKGNSGFDASSISTTNVTQTFDKENNLTVQFYTQMKDTFDYNDDTRYKFGVQGYSILMTTSKETQVTSTVNVAHPSSGVYTASYTFPENIISATVTPVFTVSEAYAESQGITFTTVYLRYQPNSGKTFKTYEPTYYTWRSNKEEDTTVTVGSKTFENKPEGIYPGQKLLYIGNNTYTVKVQSHLKGILFSYGNGYVQTFDYNEFWKLQQLGYDNITFEIKEGSNETIAAAISNTYANNGNKVYTDPVDISSIVNNDTTLSDEFFLDTNIEGFVIDVFGNKLLDTNGKPIRLTDLTGDTNAAKLSELLTKMGKSTDNRAINALYGARYGDGIYESANYSAKNGYGMEYPIRVYYFNNLKQLISQQISGYGPIEGAASAVPGKNNIESGLVKWSYYLGTNAEALDNEKSFKTDGNVISEKYKGVPYLVSYKKPTFNGDQNKTRVAGKWYYQRNIAQFNVTVKPALMTNGGIDFDNPIGGTATVNGAGTAVVNQGDTPTFEATNNTGYTFVGFYNAGGTECYGTSTPFSGHKIANNETVYAVFKKLDVGTLKVNNYVYQGTNLDPIPGGGTGNVSAKLYILRYNSKTQKYAANWEVYTNGEATINDMDKYYYVLSGTPLGADKFIAFRAKEVNKDGYVTYVKLDTLNGQPVYKESTNTYTYTSEQVVWDWETAVGTGEHTYTIDRYTDFQKVDVYATLNYHYQDRFGKDKLYVVRVRLSNEEIAHGYKPSDDKITANAPYINDLFKNCTWKVTDSELVTKTESRAEIIADHSKAIFDTYVESVNGTPDQLDLPYDSLIQLTTDKVSGDKTFSYWKQYDVDSNGQQTGDGVIFSYNRDVSVRVTFNRKFVAVYGERRDLFTTNLQDAVYTREQSTNADGTVKYDYVYSDFLTQFETSIAGKTFADVAKNGDTKSGVKNVRFGIITEYDYKQTAYTGGDLTSYKSQAKKDTVTSTIITLDGKKKDSLASGWSNSTVKDDAEYNYYYNLYDLSGSVNDLTDLGRKDFFFKFENTTKNQGKVYNVYSYVIYDDATGTHVVLSTPKFMSIYATGTKNTPVVG